jgi:hypothetical protein
MGAIAPIDLFNPTYGAQPEGPFVDEFGPDTISLLKNRKQIYFFRKDSFMLLLCSFGY